MLLRWLSSIGMVRLLPIRLTLDLALSLGSSHFLLLLPRNVASPHCRCCWLLYRRSQCRRRCQVALVQLFLIGFECGLFL